MEASKEVRFRPLVLLLLVLALVCLLTSSALAWSYAGMRWPGTSATYDHAALPSSWRTRVNYAATEWNQAGAQFTLSRAAGSSNYWATSNLGSLPGAPLARTTVSYTGSTVTRCIVRYNSNASIQWSTSGEAGKYDVQSVATHEFGHWLVLGHSEYSSAVMWPTIGTGVVKRWLSLDDVNGICAIYNE